MKIIYEDNHLLVVEKEINIPMQEDSSHDLDMLNMAKAYIKDKYDKPGEVYLGLVHRLDRPVGGVCVFARTSKAASRLSEQIRNGTFKKEYLAVVIDNNLKDEDHFEDYLLKDNKRNIVKVDDKGKYASLRYQVLKRKDNLALVKINLETGRSHQIRVQFSSRNHPLWGDQRYNNDSKVGQQLALWSSKITLIHPTLKKEMTFTSEINRYPFDI